MYPPPHYYINNYSTENINFAKEIGIILASHNFADLRVTKKQNKNLQKISAENLN